MGSAKVPNAKPQPMESKSFKPLSILKSFFHIDTKKEKAKDKNIDQRNESKTEATHKKLVQKNSENTVASILEPFKKLELQTIKKETVEQDDDERDNFTFKVIKDDTRTSRIDSQSSEDSGFAEPNDVVETLEKLTLNEKEGEDTEHTETKEKKTRQVIIKRAPIRTKVCDFNAHPYDVDNASRPISQINKQTLSGGQVIVNPTTDTFEFDEALEKVATIYNADPNYWEDVLDVITNDRQDSLLSDFPIETEHYPIDITPLPEKIPSPIEEFTEISEPAYESVELSNSLLQFENYLKNDSHSMFPTPPRSENVPSPLSETQQTFYTSTFSPERSSPIYNSDFEKYQTISPLSDEFFEEKEKKDGDRASVMSLSSMTMKNFKDLQKEISNEFSKMECCDIDREPTKKIFEQHMEKLKPIERKNLCFQVSKLDLKTAYGVIHNILLSLSKECEQEDLQYALFALTCQRVLAQNPALFVADFGLSILKAAALRCPHRPLLTRHIVHCVYLVLRSDPKLCANECVFHEVDAQCDNLVIACARGGDTYALVLAEITRSDIRGELPPLFRLHHSNADGYTALHVACRQHAATSSHLHVVHALLDHAQADMWKGDIKGGDTALHLAVNSSTCDLRLVVTLFKHLDRKMWKKLAHAQNMSSVTPLEYARSAAKSTTRQNYPTEVLDFLKKCR